MSRFARASALLLAAAAASAFVLRDPLADALASFDAAQMRAHTRFLASNLLEGRAPGTRGGELAAAYLVAQFEAIGLEPIGGRYTQPVPLVGRTLAAPPDLSFEARGRRLVPAFEDDIVVWSTGSDTTLAAGGELVFVGYGISAPEQRWDDFGDMDFTGKVLLILVNDPPAPPEEPELFGGRAMTYYGRWTYKFEEAARRGAIGALIVHTPDAAGYGWNVVQSSWTGEQIALQRGPGAPRTVPFQGWVTAGFAQRVLEAAGLDLGELFVRAARRDFVPIPTDIDVRARLETDLRQFESANVVGLLRGSDGARREDVVVYTSHYDHLGIGRAVDGDSIFNGAYDNASGVALLLEIAEAFASLPESPARSILFIATTAEESGLLGAEQYVRRPAFPLARTMAVVNIDGANLWGVTEDVVVMGADRSSLGPIVEARAAGLGLRVARDPAPEKGFFFRSDHFPFARAGVPAAYVEHGLTYVGRPAGWGNRMLEEYEVERYHGVNDEWSDAFNFNGAIQQGQLAFLIGYDVAQATDVPVWDEDSEFRAARERSRSGSR